MENTVMWPTQLESDIHAAHDAKVGCKTVECTTDLGPVHTNPFSKRCASTLIVFARPHYNAISILKTLLYPQCACSNKLDACAFQYIGQ